MALLLVGLLGFVLGGCIAIDARTVECQFDPQGTGSCWHIRPMRRRPIPETYRRHIVRLHPQRAAGHNPGRYNARYLYYVMTGGKAVRYGVTVGEEALAWSGVATVGHMAEWRGLDPDGGDPGSARPLPEAYPGGPANPLGCAGRSTCTRATRTPWTASTAPPAEYIGQAISSGLHPHDQRGCHRSCESGEARGDRRRPTAGSECMMGPITGSRS